MQGTHLIQIKAWWWLIKDEQRYAMRTFNDVVMVAITDKEEVREKLLNRQIRLRSSISLKWKPKATDIYMSDNGASGAKTMEEPRKKTGKCF